MGEELKEGQYDQQCLLGNGEEEGILFGIVGRGQVSLDFASRIVTKILNLKLAGSTEGF